MSTLFEQYPELYDRLIDWPKRLSNEAPFFRGLFERVGARRVLDVACGSGHHAAMFHGWGREVLGVDVSPQMIEFCQRQHGRSRTLRWVVGSFDQRLAEPNSFDAAICVGNSLALAADDTTAARAIGQMLSVLRAGGLCIVQVVNIWSLPDGPCCWQKFKRVMVTGRHYLLMKGIHRSGCVGWVEFLAVPLDDKRAVPAFESVRFLGLGASVLRAAAERAGAGDLQFWGDYRFSPYEPESSPDLIMVAYKQCS